MCNIYKDIFEEADQEFKKNYDPEIKILKDLGKIEDGEIKSILSKYEELIGVVKEATIDNEKKANLNENLKKFAVKLVKALKLT